LVVLDFFDNIASEPRLPMDIGCSRFLFAIRPGGVLLDTVTGLDYSFAGFTSLASSMLIMGTMIILFVGFRPGMAGSFCALSEKKGKGGSSTLTKTG